ncbi:tRNA uridine(34) 5-carboxymethylaminomethyl modification radical SAM/GNAT enzyme Elp3 [Candidatus Shapirobacteria bacterium]|nr:tRNA uridine(34) 5-carboxymethylaminomethyl modification radical SAM/GNAT enzyme Elp3 [Candidatus Shapirobacteria bacterium]
MNNIEEIIYQLLESRRKDYNNLRRLEASWAQKANHPFPKKYQLLACYQGLVKKGKIKENKAVFKLLLQKKQKTLSGVAPVAVVTKPYPCPGHCVYCPSGENVPKSYLDDEPAIRRALRLNYDPAAQFCYRAQTLRQSGHPVEKIELIILGGSFSFYSRSYRENFVKACFEAANGEKAASLEEAQRQNEEANQRLIGITIETRPDLINFEEIKFLRFLGVTKVALGTQSVFDDVLLKCKRGHRVEETARATKLLRGAGFKICYHLMPNLPGSNLEKDFKMFKIAFGDPRFRPDFLKIYPTVVLPQTELYSWWQRGEFTPYRLEELVELLVRVKKVVPPWVRIERLGRDIPQGDIAAGYRESHLRQIVQREAKRRGVNCRCIRCREIGKAKGRGKLFFSKEAYQVSGGQENFLSFVDQDKRLYSLLRLFLPQDKEVIFPCLEKAAIIRELHTYGQALPLGGKEKEAFQHRGLGRKLLGKAEEIAKNKGYSRLAVIAGVGTREYYRRQGYHLEETYMVKEINNG